MTEADLDVEGTSLDEDEERTTRAQGAVVVVLALVLTALLAFIAGRGSTEWPPGDDSAEAGFARDMVVHHAQAVEMGEIVRARSRDPAIRRLATDIVLTQQAQIGRMQGWLDAWRLPAAGGRAAMTWMGHPTEGLMPGMATEDEIASLRAMPPDRMDVRFLQLMIPHHQAAILMAEAIARVSDRTEVLALASGIEESQTAEIAYMRALLKQRGAAETEPPVQMPGDAT